MLISPFKIANHPKSIKYLPQRQHSPEMSAAYINGPIINPISMRLPPFQALFLLVLVVAAVGKHDLLGNVRIELNKMEQAYAEGRTSHAFSIAAKIYFAVQALHADLELATETPLPAAVNCQQALGSIVEMSKSPHWQQQFQSINTRIAQLHSSCTNADFSQPLTTEQPDGFDNTCALCVVILRVMDNYVNYHKVGVSDFVNHQFCTFFDGNIKPTCEAFIHFAGPLIIETLYQREPSDKVCLALGMCKDKNCRIVKAKAEEYEIDIESITPTAPAPWKWLIHLFVDHFGNGHFPAFDMDNDTYSDVSTFRGYNWRGSDCNEIKENVYPGRKTGSKMADQDCNGIFGLDNRGRLYEDKFCAPYKRYGVAVIGDSAGAHFSIPEKYFNVTLMGKGTFSDLLPRLADELDLPHESGYTGHTTTSYVSHSVYKYLRDWNLCNHNDFQNIGVNGGDAGNTWGNIQALQRDQQNDYPLIMFLELIGNDVCKKSFDSMTKPADFKRDVLKLLHYLDAKVPAGSHLMMLGLGDGNLLYENLHADTHPLNVTYATVYDFLNCLKISPCWGWLNSNDTVRNFTTERAKNLSKVYEQIVRETTFKNFDMVYYDFPAMEILQRKVMEGGDPKEMIERCDGFHPNGQFHSYLADWLWYKIKQEHADWIGQKNPHNEEIRHIFGLEVLK